MIKKHLEFLALLAVIGVGFKMYCKVMDWRLGEGNVIYPEISVKALWKCVYGRDKCSN